jgi:predicted MFS family arabinose efflux permease
MRPAFASALILGLIVGLPYYSLPYFYDYFETSYGWPRAAILLGLPLGTLITLLLPRWSSRVAPRVAVIGGALVCAIAVAGFGRTRGSLPVYYAVWLLYMTGWTFAGPLTHQIVLARVLGSKRGTGLALAFFGISLFGAFSVAAVARPLTVAFGFTRALECIGAALLLAIPIVYFGWPSVTPAPPQSHTAANSLWRGRAFWLLMIGSTMTTAGIAGVSQHLKLILRERGYTQQARLDEVFGWTLMCLLICGALGRFAFAWSLNRFPRRPVITVAFLCMLCAMPLLFAAASPGWLYCFGIVFGLGMSTDSLLLTLLAADRFGPTDLAKAMAVMVPVNTVGQTWFPYVVSLLWGWSGGYTLPLGVIFVLILGGRLLLLAMPEEAHDQSV